MKVTSQNQLAPELNSSGLSMSDGQVTSESAGRISCEQSEEVSPQVRMSTNSQLTSATACSSTTDNDGQPVQVHRKPGRPRKVKALLDQGQKVTDAAAFDIVQHKEVSTTIPLPLPESFTNSSSDDVPNAVDGHSTSASSQNETLNDKAGDAITSVAKRKRGRPKKSEAAALKVAAAPAIPPRAVGNPVWSLRSRRDAQMSKQREISQSKDGPRSPDAAPTESGNTPDNRGARKRRRRREIELLNDQKLPEKVPKLDVSLEASAALRNDTELEGETEAEKPVEPSSGATQTEMDGNSDPFSPHSEKVQEQQLTENPLQQSKVLSEPEPEATPSEDFKSLMVVEPTQTDVSPESLNTPANKDLPRTEPSSTNAVTSPEETPEAVESLDTVKTESVEINLDNFNSLSHSDNNESCLNTTVKSEDSVIEHLVFRRKKGGKRRRLISIALPRQHLVERQDPDTELKTDCGDVQKEDDVNVSPNVIHVKKGAKTLLKCGYCSQMYRFLSQLIVHQRVHTGERPFKCQECGKGFSKNSNLNLHLKVHTKNSVYETCPVCSARIFRSEYEHHIQMHRMEEEVKSATPEKPSKAVDIEDSQEVHNAPPAEKMEKSEEKTVEKTENMTEKTVEKKESTAEKTVEKVEKVKSKVCQYCGKRFLFQSALTRHVRVHTGEKPYNCDVCGKAFAQSYFLHVHELTHWCVKRYTCTRCEKSFGHYSNARKHRCKPVEGGDESRPNKPSLTYTCHICRKVFDHVQEFSRHMKGHTGTKLLRCLCCDKLFTGIAEFDEHRSWCSADKNTSSAFINRKDTMLVIRYKVPSGNISSGTNSASVAASNHEIKKKPTQVTCRKRPVNVKNPLQLTVLPPRDLSPLVSRLNQLDSRSDPRKYLCPSCGRQFRHMGRLRAHMLTHASDQSYTCALCGKTLRSWNKLWRHQRVHRRRGGRFACPQCGRGFRFVGPYRKHMKEHPEFQWIEGRPRKVIEPYQCEECSCSFKTLDLLFTHQLSHSTVQVLRRDFNSPIDCHNSQSSSKTSSPPSINCPQGSLHKTPDPICQKVTQVPIISFLSTSQPHDVDNSAQQQPSRIPSVQKRGTGRIKEITPGAPKTPVKSLTTKITSKSKEGASDDLNCAVCGNTFPAISDLFHHYLQHARGQV